MLGFLMAVLVVAAYSAVALFAYRLLAAQVRRGMPFAAAVAIYVLALYLAPSWMVSAVFFATYYLGFAADGAEPARLGILSAQHLHLASFVCYGIGIAALMLAIRGFRSQPRVAGDARASDVTPPPVEPGDWLSMPARIGYGIVLSIAAFLGIQYVLLATDPHPDSWGGMGIFFTTLLATPVLLAANAWVLVLRWRRGLTAFLAGLALPLTIIVPTAMFAFGSSRWSPVLPLYTPWMALYALPLIAALVLTRRQRARAV